MARFPAVAAIALSAAIGMFAVSGAKAADLDQHSGAMSNLGAWYLELLVGGATDPSADVTIAGGLGPASYDPDGKTGFSVAVGRYVTDNWRVELAWARDKAGGGSLTFPGGLPLPHMGNVVVNSYMINALYSFDLGSALRPFIGAGLGIADYDADNVGLIGGAFVVSGSDSTMVVALHGGLDYYISDRVALTGRISAAHTGEVTLASTPAGAATTKDSEWDLVLRGGVRILFGR